MGNEECELATGACGCGRGLVEMFSFPKPFCVFTARCYASAVLDMALCLSVRHKSEFY